MGFRAGWYSRVFMLTLSRRMARRRTGLLVLSCLLGTSITALHGGALENYVSQPDAEFGWKLVQQRKTNGFTVTQLELTSQKWREHAWQHTLQVVRPTKVRNPGIAFLYVTGDGRGTRSLGILMPLAERAGALAAVVTRVPNQPLYGDRKEDALIAYTFDQYLKSGDETWPLLFPMVKSAVRAMDAVQAFAQKEYQEKIEGFVVGGASKRGWTTWLTAAADPRVKGIAPMVIDMLNMKVQTDWAEQMYGKQSEQIHDYVDLGLVRKMETPEMLKLRDWVDPYSYRNRYTMPKLILLGTNDPYWTVDALRHYWYDLPGPKLIFQTPNAGHDLGGGEQALQSLAAFFQMIADRQELPKLDWTFADAGNGKAQLQVFVTGATKRIRLWTADSSDRDFRDNEWTSRDLEITPGSSKAATEIATPKSGYRAYLVEAVLTTANGKEYKLSTEARVTPDGIR